MVAVYVRCGGAFFLKGCGGEKVQNRSRSGDPGGDKRKTTKDLDCPPKHVRYALQMLKKTNGARGESSKSVFVDVLHKI